MSSTQIRSHQILDHDLTHDDIANNTVRGTTANVSGTVQEIAQGTISTPDLRDAAVSPLKIDSTQSFSMSALTLSSTTNQLVLGTTNTVTVNSTAPASSRTYTIPETGANSSFVMTDGTQTINGSKSFSSNVTLSAANSGIQVNGGGGTSGFIDFYGSASGQYRIALATSSINTTVGANTTLQVGIGSLTISPTSSPTFTFNSTGLQLSSGIIRNADGTVGAPSYTFGSDTTTGMYKSGSAVISFATGGSLAVSVNAVQQLDMNNHKIINVLDPTGAQDAATKNYVDSVANGITWKQSVRLATAAALATNTYSNGASGVGATLTATGNGALSVDGVAVAVNNRILVKNEATAANNGIYLVTATGDGTHPYILTRTNDFDQSAEIVEGDAAFVGEGTVNADSGWVMITTGTITVGTSSVSFTQFTGLGQITAGTALSKTGNTLNVNVDNTTIDTNGSNQLEVKTGGITNTQVSASAAIVNSKLSFTTAILAADGTVSAPEYSFTSDSDTGVWRQGTNSLSISTNGTEVIRFNASQNTDFLQHQALQLVVEVRASDPSTPIEGQIWYRSDTHQWLGYNGTTNVVLG